MKILQKMLRNGAAVFIILGVVSAHATADETSARNFVEKISKEAVGIMSNTNTADDIKIHQLTRLFNDAVDTKWIAKFVLGHHWNQLSAQQQTDYTKVFHKYLEMQYIPKFKNYNNQTYEIHRVAKDDEGEYTVYTTLHFPEGQNVSLSYKVHESTSNKFKIYDVVAEGISLLNTQRSEFGSVIAREGTDSLIKKLNARTQVATY